MSSRLPASLLGLSVPFFALRIVAAAAAPIPISMPPPPPPRRPGRLPLPPPRPHLFSTTAAASARVRRKPFNPFAATISKKRKEDNLARQTGLAKERQAQAVDPVLGRPTPFLESLAHVPPPLPPLDAVLATPTAAAAGAAGAASTTATAISDDDQLNHYVTPAELRESLARSRTLAEPVAADPDYGVEEEHRATFERQHAHNVEAIRRILALAAGNSADRTRAHKQACIALFGRHVTDSQLPPDPGSARAAGVDTGKTPRAGPDTGSSEVQAAILTVKIQALARALHRDDGHNTKDKHNKRNLRLLVHRRQKLLKFLKRKEKGGVRYRNVMAALGLDDDAVHRELFL